MRNALLVLLAAAAALPCRAFAQESHTSTALGPRAVFYRANDSDHGTWNVGGQLNVGAGPNYVAQVSVDSTHHSAAGTDFRVIPVQVSLIGYLTPADPASFYLLAGYGWYLTRVRGPGAHGETLTHPHVGFGLELLSGVNWTFDAGYRFIWSEVWRPLITSHPYGENFHKRGSMITLSLLRRF